MSLHHLILFLLFQIIKGRIFQKNPYVIRKDRRNNSSKVICKYYGDKVYIRSLCHIMIVKVPNDIMTWIPKGSDTNP